MPQIAKVFNSGNSQAVRLPKEFRLNVDEVEISREGDALILRPHKTDKEAWSSLKAALNHGFQRGLSRWGSRAAIGAGPARTGRPVQMMRYVLDTNAVIHLVSRKSDTLVRLILEKREGEIGIPSIVAHELYFGVYKSQKVSFNLEALRLLLTDFPILEFDQEDARVSGELRSALAQTGAPIGPYDVLIAGQAKARDLTVITNNVREFKRVDGLKVEDWTA